MEMIPLSCGPTGRRSRYCNLQSALLTGDSNHINFAAVREQWLARLSASERAAIDAYEATTEADLDFSRVTPDQVQYLGRLGCWNPPRPDALH